MVWIQNVTCWSLECCDEALVGDSLSNCLHPGRLAWNLRMMVWKMIFLFNWVIFRFHVNLPGCKRWTNIAETTIILLSQLHLQMCPPTITWHGRGTSSSNPYPGRGYLSSLEGTCIYMYIYIYCMYTFPETNIAPENRPSQKETSLPTIHFQGLC